MRTYTITSFTGLNKIIINHWKGHYVYRGVDSSKYKLLPSYGRDQQNNPQNSLYIEKTYLEEFKRKAIPFLEFEPTSELDWIAIAQHHGLHTRLLDWTSNPLVAAYFAVRNYEKNRDAAIYILDRSKMSTADEGIEPFSISETYLYYPKHISQRIVSQSGLFTLHHKPDLVLQGDFLEKVIIKEKCLIDMFLMLETYGITHLTMFPGLEGLSKVLTENYIRPKDT